MFGYGGVTFDLVNGRDQTNLIWEGGGGYEDSIQSYPYPSESVLVAQRTPRGRKVKIADDYLEYFLRALSRCRLFKRWHAQAAAGVSAGTDGMVEEDETTGLGVVRLL